MAFGRATIILGLLQAATSLIFDFGGSMQWLAGVAGQVVGFIGTSFANAANYVAGLAQAIGSVVPGMNALSGTLRAFALTTKVHVAAGTLTKDFTKWAGSLKTADDGLGDLGSTAGGIPFGDYADQTDDWANKTDGLGNAAGGAAREVRTLVDYASDLQSVFSRAFDIRFSGESTLDAIRSSFISIKEASEESARNIAKLKAEIQGLQSDLNIQKIFLGIALEYGDTARAEAIQANIAKLQADLADKTASLSDEQSKNSKTLTGNSKAALANRKQMEDLVKQYQEHITALASSGLSQDELARRTAQLREQFVQQATQLGYSRVEVEKYARAFDDIRVAIQGVPRNITVTANANPALQALSEFMARAKTQIGSGLSVPISATPDYRGLSSQGRAGEIQGNMQNALANMVAAAARGDIVASQRWRVDLIRWATILKNGGFSGGGFTGAGGKYEPAGIVHRGEYVIPKKDVNQRTGLPYADAMGRLQRGASGPGYANGGFVRGGAGNPGIAQIGSLGPMAQQQFAQLFEQYMRVYLDGQVIARSSANQYSDQTKVGAY
jgi:phage host-nuclease inhibitor protein Gam